MCMWTRCHKMSCHKITAENVSEVCSIELWNYIVEQFLQFL